MDFKEFVGYLDVDVPPHLERLAEVIKDNERVSVKIGIHGRSLRAQLLNIYRECAMPNHVKHKMTIVGPETSVRAFVKQARAPRPMAGDETRQRPAIPLSFHAIVPLPSSFHVEPYSPHGYNLECKTWGTKWGAYQCEEPAEANGRVTYSFTCAWCLPGKWLRQASINWPTLKFFVSYGGEGPCAGRVLYYVGCTLYNEQPEYDPKDYPEGDEEDPNFDEAEFNDKYVAAQERYLRVHDEWVASKLD